MLSSNSYFHVTIKKHFAKVEDDIIFLLFNGSHGFLIFLQHLESRLTGGCILPLAGKVRANIKTSPAQHVGEDCTGNVFLVHRAPGEGKKTVLEYSDFIKSKMKLICALSRRVILEFLRETIEHYIQKEESLEIRLRKTNLWSFSFYPNTRSNIQFSKE